MTASSIPLNDLQRLYCDNADAITRSVAKVTASGWWLSGQETKAFCSEFAAYLGIENCISVANGTDALELALRALLHVRGFKRREVVTVANAGGYATIACRILNLVPVYVDIERKSQLASIPSILAALTPDTAVVIVTHLYGGVFDVPFLRDAMNAAGYVSVPIVEDCAQAHGGILNGELVGTFGDISTFSFYPTKNLGALGDAGAIVTPHAEVAHLVRSMAQYGWSSKYEIELSGGRNSRMDEIQASILRVLLPKLNDANARRQQILQRYENAVPSGIQVVRSSIGTVAHLAIVLCGDRDRLRLHLAGKGISSDVHYPILDCDQSAWKNLPHRIVPTGIEESRRSIKSILTLPCFPTMTDDEVERVCQSLREWSV